MAIAVMVVDNFDAKIINVHISNTTLPAVSVSQIDDAAFDDVALHASDVVCLFPSHHGAISFDLFHL